VLPEQRRPDRPSRHRPGEYPAQHRVIRQLTEAASIVLSDGRQMTMMALIALITRKRQANVWPGGIELRDADGEVIFSVGDEVQESVKLDEAQADILRYHSEGHRQVVFSQFSTGINEFARRLEAGPAGRGHHRGHAEAAARGDQERLLPHAGGA
jgi:hypothetical protein